MSGTGLRYARFFAFLMVFSFLAPLARAQNEAAQPNRPVLRVRGDYVYPPYEFLREGRADGFNVELIRAVGEVMGLEMEVSLGPWNEVRTQLERGEIDILTGMFHSPERERGIAFSVPHSLVFYDIFVREDSPIRSPEDLRDRRIIVQRGDIMHDYLRNHRITPHITAIDDVAAILRLLSSGRHDCAIVAKLAGLYYIDAYRLTNLRSRELDFPPQKYCFAVSPDDTLLLAQLNQGLDILKASGRYRAIHEKWFGVYERQSFLTAARPWFIALGIALALLALSAAWMISLRRQVRRKTDALRESEERLRCLVEYAPDAIFVQIQSRFAFVNPAALRIFGAETTDVLLGQSILDRIAPECRDFVRERIRAAREEHSLLPVVECRYIRMDGSSLNVEVSSVPIVWSGERGALVFVRDITGRKEAENALRQSEERHRLFLMNFTGIAYQAELLTFRTVFFHGMVAEMTGYSGEDFTSGRVTWDRLIHPDDRERVTRQGGRISTEPGYVADDTYRIVARDGSVRWVRDIARRVDLPGGTPAIQGSLYNVTGRMLAEAALRDSERRYRLLAENARDVIYRLQIKPHFAFEYLSPSVLHVTGYSPEEFYADPELLFRIVGREDKRNLRRMIRRRNYSERLSVRWTARNGRSVWTEQRISPVFGEFGQVVAVEGIARDITERRRVEEELARREAQYRELVESAGSVILRIDREGSITFINEFGRHFFGYPAAGLVGKNIFDTILPRSDSGGRDQTGLVSDILINPVRYLTHENENVKRSGERVWISWNNRVIRNDMGTVTEVLCIGQDVTARRRAEEAIMESEYRFRTLFDTISSGVAVYEAQGDGDRGEDYVVRDYNRAALEMEHRTKGEVVGKTLADLRPNIDDYGLVPVLRRVRETGRGEYLPVTRYEDDRITAWYENHVFRLPSGEIVTVFNDLTERIHAREALRDREERYREVFENTSDCFFLIDVSPDGGFRHNRFNPAAERVLGVTTGQAAGKLVEEVLRPDLAAEVLARYRDCVEAGAPISYEEEPELESGRRVFSTTLIPVRNEEGIIHRIVGVARDITERRRAEAAFREQEKQYRLLFETMQQGVVYQNSDSAIISMNPAAERILGRSSEEYLGQTSEGVEHTTIREDGSPFPGRDHPANEALRTGRAVSNVVMGVYNPREAACRWIDVTAVPLFREGESRPYQVYTVFDDITARKEAEAALRESEERFRSVLENSLDAAYRRNYREDRYDYMSPVIETITGIRPEALCGMSQETVRALICPEDLPGVTAELAVVMNGERDSGSFEYRFRRGDGEIRWLSDSFTVIRDGDGVPVYGIGVVRDITGNKRAEGALRESERKFRQLFDEMLTGFALHEIILDEAGNPYDYRYLEVNRSFERLTGLRREQVLGRTVREVLPGVEPAWIERYSEVALTGASQVFEDFSGDMDKYFEVSVFSPQRGRFATVFQDVTLRRRAEEELRKALDSLRAIIDAAPLAIFDLDTGSRIRSIWNPTAERMYGWTREEALGQFLPTVPPDHLEEHYKLRERVLRNESFTSVEAQRRRKDGTPIDALLATAPLHAGDGTVNGIMVICEDITERKRLERQFLQAQKMETVGRLAGGIAHDFNNLLTAIIGNAELSLMSVPPGSELAADLEDIRRTAERAAALTRQLLAFSRRQIIEPRSLNLNDVLLDLDKMLRRLIGETIELITLPDVSLRTVKADPGQIEQVLTNLVVNARDAMPGGGLLTIETRNATLDEEYVRDHPDAEPGEYVMIAVTDTGVGMDSRVLAHLFEPFFTTKERGKGTGLGLSTCYGIVKQNRGGIWVYSEPGRGTSVKVYLPAAEGETTDSQALPVDPAPRGTETVLVVEDDPSVRAMTVRILSGSGYRVLEAADGRKAIKIADTHAGRIHLLLTDVVMPRMGGKELAEEMERLHPDTRVLFMSGYTGNAIIYQGALDRGVSFIQKPFPPAVLLRKVREVLEGGNHA